jgi:hypothetical protein
MPRYISQAPGWTVGIQAAGWTFDPSLTPKPGQTQLQSHCDPGCHADGRSFAPCRSYHPGRSGKNQGQRHVDPRHLPCPISLGLDSIASEPSEKSSRGSMKRLQGLVGWMTRMTGDRPRRGDLDGGVWLEQGYPVNTEC